MFSRVIAGARSILVIAPLATLLGTVLGTALGLAMGYLGGWTDNVASRIVEAVLALPVVIVAFLFVVALGPSTRTLIIVIGFVFTPLIARTVRSAVLSERELDYVAAARLRGERAPYIMFVEILPNVLQPILVEFTVRLGYAIFAVATLSFLGFGIQPPTPDWGGDISVNYAEITAGYWWETLFPGARDRVAGGGRQPDRRRDLGGARGMSAAAEDTAAKTAALDVANVDVAYRVRGRDRLVLRDVSFTRRPGRVLRPGRRVGLGQVDRWRSR